MKKNALVFFALGTALASAGFLLAQPAATPTPSAAVPPGQKLVRIVTINGVQANRDFQANVEMVQTQRRAVLELNTALERETNAARKKDLKTQLDAVLAKLNENNAAMQKAYGFSIMRDYVMEVETSHIYLIASDEEAARIEQAEKEQQARDAKDAKK